MLHVCTRLKHMLAMQLWEMQDTFLSFGPLPRCQGQALPLVFALTRKKLGQIYGFRKRVSAVALMALQVRGLPKLLICNLQLSVPCSAVSAGRRGAACTDGPAEGGRVSSV